MTAGEKELWSIDLDSEGNNLIHRSSRLPPPFAHKTIYIFFFPFTPHLNTFFFLCLFDCVYAQLAVAFGKECERLIDQYIQRVADHVQNKVGKCWPLSQAYNTTTTVICQQIFWPFVSFDSWPKRLFHFFFAFKWFFFLTNRRRLCSNIFFFLILFIDDFKPCFVMRTIFPPLAPFSSHGITEWISFTCRVDSSYFLVDCWPFFFPQSSYRGRVRGDDEAHIQYIHVRVREMNFQLTGRRRVRRDPLHRWWIAFCWLWLTFPVFYYYILIFIIAERILG